MPSSHLLSVNEVVLRYRGHAEQHYRDRDRDRGVYRVLVRHRGHWDDRGTYRDRAARRLERRGYDARVERVRGW